MEQMKIQYTHDDVIKWKPVPRYWSFVRGIHWSPVNSLYKGQWHGALIFTLICSWINGWVNNRESGDLRRHRAHYDVIVMGNMVYKIYTCWMIFKLYSTLVLNHPFTCATPRRLFTYNMYNFHEITRSDNLPCHTMKLPLCFACTYPWADS